MVSIPQKELRNQVSEVLRRVEAGETLTVTVAGREVTELGPVRKHRWVSGSALERVWQLNLTDFLIIEDLLDVQLP